MTDRRYVDREQEGVHWSPEGRAGFNPGAASVRLTYFISQTSRPEVGSDDHDTERRKIDPGLVAQQYECDEDHGEAEHVSAERGRADRGRTALRGARHDRRRGEEVDEHDAERDRRARRAVPAADASPATRMTTGAIMQTALHDVERDLAFDERGYRLFSHGFPSSSRATWALYV